MRIGMVSFLCAFLLWMYSPLPVVAQINPPGDQRLRTFSSVKLVELPNLPVSDAAGFRTDSAKVPSKMPQFDKQIRPQQKTVGLFGTQLTTEDTQCAHILKYRPPAVDSKMIIGVPKEFASKMPSDGGLPPCPGDLRGVMFKPQPAPLEPITPLDPPLRCGSNCAGS